MRKLLAAVAISALALTSVVPLAEAAQRPASAPQAESQHVHKVAAQKKKVSAKKPAKSTKGKATKVSKKKRAPAKTTPRRAA